MKMTEHIVLQNVYKTFSKKNHSETVALEDVSLSIKRGEFISLLGPSGCGKSTLLNIIAGLEKETSGQVLINGSPITGPGNDRIVVFQESGLFPWMTVLENVMYGLLIKKCQKKKQRCGQ